MAMTVAMPIMWPCLQDRGHKAHVVKVFGRAIILVHVRAGAGAAGTGRLAVQAPMHALKPVARHEQGVDPRWSLSQPVHADGLTIAPSSQVNHDST